MSVNLPIHQPTVAIKTGGELPEALCTTIAMTFWDPVEKGVKGLGNLGEGSCTLRGRNVVIWISGVLLFVQRPGEPIDVAVKIIRPTAITTTLVAEDTLMGGTIRITWCQPTLVFKIGCRNFSIGTMMSGIVVHQHRTLNKPSNTAEFHHGSESVVYR